MRSVVVLACLLGMDSVCGGDGPPSGRTSHNSGDDSSLAELLFAAGPSALRMHTVPRTQDPSMLMKRIYTKATRTNFRNRAYNQLNKNKMKNKIRYVMRTIARGGSFSNASMVMRTAQSEIDKNVKRGVIHKNKGNRKKSRLAQKVWAIKDRTENLAWDPVTGLLEGEPGFGEKLAI
mmetsp:Transcript_104194/g.164422  ORF Transcript_104194/g.164422 Transcript_104194/m.164422 type:complete len:177 (-) Transcript_104194:147-677(-)|eukprot:CAMPEP_0169175066 /NCGR_PEP_ID=MMETSP1015-20121227/64982_1 /TAXON_ID=342587 /ORGANISM="Karlodinium micrum, Strain CCMP2283" /LENGTH=176 /DNA_ID=CAMNT_0009249169 /DNA_START=40 /DNA_END=570 /DNA_ORIENTATION=-